MRTLCLIYVWACRVASVALVVGAVYLLMVDRTALRITLAVMGVAAILGIIFGGVALYERARRRLER